jgi:hypothetical protein
MISLTPLALPRAGVGKKSKTELPLELANFVKIGGNFKLAINSVEMQVS